MGKGTPENNAPTTLTRCWESLLGPDSGPGPCFQVPWMRCTCAAYQTLKTSPQSNKHSISGLLPVLLLDPDQHRIRQCEWKFALRTVSFEVFANTDPAFTFLGPSFGRDCVLRLEPSLGTHPSNLAGLVVETPRSVNSTFHFRLPTQTYHTAYSLVYRPARQFLSFSCAMV